MNDQKPGALSPDASQPVDQQPIPACKNTNPGLNYYQLLEEERRQANLERERKLRRRRQRR